MKTPKLSKFVPNVPLVHNETVTKLRDLHYGKAYFASDFWYAWEFRKSRLVSANHGRPFTSEAALLQWGLENGYNRFFVHFSVTSRLAVASSSK